MNAVRTIPVKLRARKAIYKMTCQFDVLLSAVIVILTYVPFPTDAEKVSIDKHFGWGAESYLIPPARGVSLEMKCLTTQLTFDLKFSPNATAEPTRPPRLKVAQNMPI